MKIAIISNPTAGQYSEEKILSLLKKLRDEKKIVYYFSTCYKEHIIELIKLIKRLGINTIILAGGDGTVSSALSELIFSQIKILILPFGTANVLHKALNIDFDIDNIIDLLRKEKTVYLNSGEIKTETKTANFVLMASVGFDAQVVKLVDNNLNLKKKIGKLSYLFYSVCVFLKSALKKIIIISDTEKEILTNQLLISNINFYAGDFLLQHGQNNLFEKIKIFKSCLTKKNFIILILDFFLKRDFCKIFQHIEDVQKLKILNKGLPIQIDGDYFDEAPCEIFLKKKSLIFYHNLKKNI